MNKRKHTCRALAMLMALSVVTSGISLPGKGEKTLTASAADGDSRITVDLNANDGRKASYARWCDNWSVPGGSSASTTIDGVTFKLSNGGSAGGDIRSVNCKTLQLQSGIYPYLTMDGVTIDDTTSGGVIKLEISGLSAGTHSLKTWHSCVDNTTVGTVSVTINGQKTASGVSCPTRVTDEDNAGIAYSTFTVSSGQTVTVLISPEGSGNAWLNGFELDGGDPINGISRITPEDQEKHHDASKGLSWTAGKNAASHNVYIGTDAASVFNATTSSAEFKGNQTGTTFTLDETYTSVPTYYWRVDTIDSSGNVIKGSVNSFNLARLAFPTAEGYGRYARGGQGGVVVHVTNLKDDGSEGSLRWALCDPKWQTDDWKGVPRIVVFDVGGVITLSDTLCIPDNAGQVYVAGQTAPGDGITLIKHDFGAMGTSDVIIRDVRVRVGEENQVSTGGMGLNSCNHTIIDHCSISWATDEGFSSRNAMNITFQWNIVGETLNNSIHYLDEDRTQTERHSFAASIGGFTGSYHHNLLIHNTGRNWSLAGAMEQDAKTYGGQADIRNNVVYNWRDRTTDGGIRRLNFVNNYYKAGPVSNTNMHIVSMDGNELNTNDMQKMYVSGNMMVANNGSVLLAASDNAWDKGKAVSGGKNSTTSDVRSDSPFFESYVNTQSAEDAYKSVIASAGAGGTSSTGWDYIDTRYISDVNKSSYTLTGSRDGLKGIIDTHMDAGGYPNSSTFAHSTDGATNATNDTDRDGMPNVWENEHGLNPNDASDGAICTLSADGYTNVEMYLNELIGDPVEYNGTTLKKGAVMNTEVTYVFENVNSGLYLEVANGEAANGTDVIQGTTGANGWKLKDVGEGYYKVYSEVGDGQTYLLDLDYGNTANGTNIGIWSDTESDAQCFKFVSNSDGTYSIYTKSTKDTSCIGITSGSSEPGASAIQWATDGSTNQKWIAHIKLEGTLFSQMLVKEQSGYTNWQYNDSLEAGDLVFSDRDVTFVTLPEELLGAEAILTSCDAKNLNTDLATLTAASDMVAYVAIDARVVNAPVWLTEWTQTELTATNSKDVTFNLYKKELTAGETITLGQNGQSSGCVNYVVFATSAETVVDPPVDPPFEPTEIRYGDVNESDSVEISDIVLLSRYVSQDTTLQSGAITEQGLANADVSLDGSLTSEDISGIARFIVGLTQLPL